MSGSEERKATGSWALDGSAGAGSGDGALEVGDSALSAGGTSVEYLDVDSIADAERVVTLSLFPTGTVRLSQLGRRHETFVAALRAAWDAARTAGVLAHGITAPQVFPGTLRRPPPEREAAFLVHPTHVAVVPREGEVEQVPLGAVQAIRFDQERWTVTLDLQDTPDGPFEFGQLARQTDPFFRAVSGAREAQARRLSEISGTGFFTDGGGVPASKLPGFGRLLESWAAPERLEGAKALLAKGSRAETRIGLVDLLDPDEEGLAAKVALPGNLAAFLLVPVGGNVVLEVLSGPSAATYLFRGGIEGINRDLQAIHFRRRALSLSPAEAEGSAGRPYRLAFRKLEPLKRLRGATAARVVHSEGWIGAIGKALSAASWPARR